jgi:hypothetical protein
LISIVWFAMAAILNPKWLPKYKNPPIWTKFGFQVDYDVANWYPSLVCYGGHFERPPKYKNPPIWLQNTPRYQFSLKSETIDKMATIANQRLISIRNIIIYLEIKFLPNRRIFVFWWPFKMATLTNQRWIISRSILKWGIGW